MPILKYLTLVSLIFLTGTVTHADQVPIKIGWIGPLSGNSAVLGIDSVQAAQIAVDEFNEAGGIPGHTVVLVSEDDQYDTAKALTSYNKLVNLDQVKAILMSTYGGIFATAKKAIKDGVIMIDPLDCNNAIAELGENTFCIATESESIGRIIAEDISDKKFSSIGVIYDESNPFMVLVNDSLRHRLEELGISDIYDQGVSRDTSDFKSILIKFKKQGIQSLVLFGHDPMGGAMKQARGLGIDSQFYTVGTITSPGYQSTAGESANGTLVAFWEAPGTEAYEVFIKKFTEKAGRPPILELATIPSYDSMKLLLTAISKSINKNSGIDIEKVRKSLLKTNNYPGLSGTLSMDPDGAVRTIREKIYTYESGKLVK
jgi:branched-chain amino acid transport system substrate-binding protein